MFERDIFCFSLSLVKIIFSYLNVAMCVPEHDVYTTLIAKISSITKTCPCNIQQFFTAVNNEKV